MNFANVTEWRIPVDGVTRDVLRVTRNNIVLWEKKTGPDYSEPFYVKNITNQNETLSILKNDVYAYTLTIQYSIDKVNWHTLGSTSTAPLTRTLSPGEKLYLRCRTDRWAYSDESEHRNMIRGISEVGGNIMSLLYGNTFTGSERVFPTNDSLTFKNLFYLNTTLVNSDKLLLPATTLNESCYGDMFHRCTSLVNSPELNSDTLSFGCYSNMFYDCLSLVNAPKLPATTLVVGCYNDMFNGCTSLVNSPELPAQILRERCYYHMFSRCENLKTVKCLATSLNTGARTLENWLANVSATGTFTKAAGVTWPTGQSGIPSGWTVVEQ